MEVGSGEALLRETEHQRRRKAAIDLNYVYTLGFEYIYIYFLTKRQFI